MTFSECLHLKEIAETADIGGDSLQFHEDAIHDCLLFKNAMESMSQDISKAIEDLIKEAKKEWQWKEPRE